MHRKLSKTNIYQPLIIGMNGESYRYQPRLRYLETGYHTALLCLTAPVSTSRPILGHRRYHPGPLATSSRQTRKRVGPLDSLEPVQDGLKPWLAEYLQQAFEYAEHWRTELWATTQDWNMDKVREALRLTELNRKGVSVMEDAEVRLQIQWRKEGNWKAGSIPLKTQEALRFCGPQHPRVIRDLFGAE